MLNIFQKLLLKQQIKTTINKNEVVQLYNTSYTDQMIARAAYRVQSASLDVFVSQYCDFRQEILYSANVTHKGGSTIETDRKYAKKF